MWLSLWPICDIKSNSLKIFKDEPNSSSLVRTAACFHDEILEGSQPHNAEARRDVWGMDDRRPPNQVLSDELKWNTVNRMNQKERNTITAKATKPEKSGRYKYRKHNHLKPNI